MSSPECRSHRTFSFGNVVIDSNFDSGNCSNAEKNSQNNYDIWIGTDHQKNNYRSWFHFSVSGITKGSVVAFNIKNMQDQSRLLCDGLLPVYREESSKDWKRIRHRINPQTIEYNEGWIEWTFKHTITSNEKVYLAFYYPWSNQDNSKFLFSLQYITKYNPSIYFYRTTIIRSLEQRPVEFVVISSKKHQLHKEQSIEDSELFKQGKRPLAYKSEKKGIVLSARVHPGQIPGSHVMNGILQHLTSDSSQAQLLRDTFVFYIFPILNPDGVGRGHYRVDTNGINLNRCYLNPSPKNHPSIYAIKNIIMHLHKKDRFFGFLDLHAHASRKGTFIYGNSTNQLNQQVEICLFPKMLSMNSSDFQYEASNFTQQHMHFKEKGDHMSKQGSGRVAIFKSTKNPYSWTLECTYNMNRVQNILESRKEIDEEYEVDVQDLDEKIITEYKCFQQEETKEFMKIQTYKKIGREICQTFLDLVEKNPYSRINNRKNHFRSIQYLRMNLAVALLRMAPQRFQQHYKKFYFGLITNENDQQRKKLIKILYYLLIKKVKIQNIGKFVKQKEQIKQKRIVTSQSKVLQEKSIKSERHSSIRIKKKISVNEKKLEQQRELISPSKISYYSHEGNELDESRLSNLLNENMKNFQKNVSYKKINIDLQEIRMIGIHNLNHSMFNGLNNKSIWNKKLQKLGNKNKFRIKIQELPTLSLSSKKQSLGMVNNSMKKSYY